VINVVTANFIAGYIYLRFFVKAISISLLTFTSVISTSQSILPASNIHHYLSHAK